MSQIDKIIALAQSQVGYKADPNGFNKYNLEYYGYNSSAAWCVVFQWWLFKHCNLSQLFYGGKKTASCGTLYNYYKQCGQTISPDKMRPGDLVEFTFDGVEHCHIGLCIDFDGKNVTTIDGNTSEVGSQSNGGQVLVRKRGIGCVYGVIRPAYAEDKPPIQKPKFYVVKPGDNLTRIAMRFGTTVDELMKLNPKIANPNLIYKNQRIRIK